MANGKLGTQNCSCSMLSVWGRGGEDGNNTRARTETGFWEGKWLSRDPPPWIVPLITETRWPPSIQQYQAAVHKSKPGLWVFSTLSLVKHHREIKGTKKKKMTQNNNTTSTTPNIYLSPFTPHQEQSKISSPAASPSSSSSSVSAAAAAAAAEKSVRLFGVEISKKKSYKCKHCGMKFKTCQALGGHQNAHKRHRNRPMVSPPLYSNPRIDELLAEISQTHQCSCCRDRDIAAAAATAPPPPNFKCGDGCCLDLRLSLGKSSSGQFMP